MALCGALCLAALLNGRFVKPRSPRAKIQEYLNNVFQLARSGVFSLRRAQAPGEPKLHASLCFYGISVFRAALSLAPLPFWDLCVKAKQRTTPVAAQAPRETIASPIHNLRVFAFSCFSFSSLFFRARISASNLPSTSQLLCQLQTSRHVTKTNDLKIL